MTEAPTGFAPSPAGYAVPPPQRLLTDLAAAQEAFAVALAAGDPAAPVTSCPGWTLRDLAWHLGTVHRWVVGAVVEGRALDLEETGPDDPDDAGALVAWYRAAAADVHGLLAATPPDAPCWHFGPRPRTVRFWVRRQAHETAMHALDAALAAGTPDAVYPAALAVDGIDEVVTMFHPRQVRLGRTAAPVRSLAVAPDEAAGVRWLIGPPDGAGAEATLHGPAALLLQVLWKRVPPDVPGVTVVGDHGAAGAVLAARLTP